MATNKPILAKLHKLFDLTMCMSILLLKQLYLTFIVLSTFFLKIMYLLLFAASWKSLTLTMPPVNGSEKQTVKHVTAL